MATLKETTKPAPLLSLRQRRRTSGLSLFMEKKRRKQKTVRDQEDALLAKQLRPLTRLLLQITDDLDWGEKYDTAPMHANRKEMMLRYLQGLCYVLYPKKLTQKALRQHFRGERTLYFTGSRGDLSLVYIDPDCHNSGSKEGAFQFLEFLKVKYFPNLYYEASTHGNGGSGYIIVDRSTCSDKDFNGLLKQLDKFLKRVLATTTYDVEDIEVKGTCPEITWSAENKHWVEKIKCGGLAKFPREMITRADEFMATTRLTTDELQAIVDSPLPEEELPTPAPTEEEIVHKSVGSVRTKQIDVNRIRWYLPLAEQLMGRTPHQVGNQIVANVKDCAIFLTLLEFFTLNPNADGSLPQKRFMELWQAMYECGDISRAWDNKRFAYLRNLLSDKGCIHWINNKYEPNWGRAMRWHASAELMSKLLELRQRSEEMSQSGQKDANNTDNTMALVCSLGGRSFSCLDHQMAGRPKIRPQMVSHVFRIWGFEDNETLKQAIEKRKKAA